MLPIVQIGPLALPAPELILLIGFWIGLNLTEKQAGRFRADPGHLYNLVFIALLVGLVGARLAYAAQSPAAFLENPLNLLSPRPQMFNAAGGLAAALLAGLVYLRVRRLALWPTLDALTSLLAVLAVTLGLSHLASGDAYGMPADLPWSIHLWGEARHPSQIYETLAALLIAAATWPGARLARPSLYRIGAAAEMAPAAPGWRFWVFLALSAAARLFLEAFRGDSALLAGFRQPQLLALLILAVSLWQIGRRLSHHLASEQTVPGRSVEPPAQTNP